MLKIIFLLCCCTLPNNLSGQGIFLPQVTESENIIHHFAFSLLYSEKHEQPKWVAYTLTKEQLEYPKMSSRDGTEFVPDPDIKEQIEKLQEEFSMNYELPVNFIVG